MAKESRKITSYELGITNEKKILQRTWSSKTNEENRGIDMKVKIKPFSISDPQKPFAGDALNREEYAKVLMQLFSNTEEPLTLAINSGWGTGKTTFVLMLQQLLENEGFPTILFNAWENDYSDNALISLIGEVLSKIKEYKKKYHIIEDDIKQFTEVGVKLIKSIAPLTNIISLNQINLENAKEIQNTFSYTFAKSKLVKYTESKKDITQFKIHLQKYVKTITNFGTNEFKPLIFFIDELDRCRPNYSIELLEKLKHIFDIEGVIFVLSIDKEELEKTIKVVYGDIKIDGYLRKFIDFTYNLPAPSIEDFCKHLLKQYGFEDYINNKQSKDFKYAYGRITETMSAFANAFNFSLRKIEQCFSQLSIVLKTTDSNSDFFPIFTILLICIKNNNDEKYSQYISNKMDDRRLELYLRSFPILEKFLETNYGFALKGYAMLAVNNNSQKIHQLHSKVLKGNASIEQQQISSSIKEITKNRDMFFMQNNLLEYLTKKIEITDSFSTE